MWEKIKKILQKEGGKCIIMKEGEPTYIVTRLDNYEECLEGKPQETEKINQNIAEWKDSEAAAQNDEKDQEVKIEDLPF